MCTPTFPECLASNSGSNPRCTRHDTCPTVRAACMSRPCLTTESQRDGRGRPLRPIPPSLSHTTPARSRTAGGCRHRSPRSCASWPALPARASNGSAETLCRTSCRCWGGRATASSGSRCESPPTACGPPADWHQRSCPPASRGPHRCATSWRSRHEVPRQAAAGASPSCACWQSMPWRRARASRHPRGSNSHPRCDLGAPSRWMRSPPPALCSRPASSSAGPWQLGPPWHRGECAQLQASRPNKQCETKEWASAHADPRRWGSLSPPRGPEETRDTADSSSGYPRRMQRRARRGFAVALNSRTSVPNSEHPSPSAPCRETPSPNSATPPAPCRMH
mmetsp:Transcript_103415/g.299166  ORF Transcript_103415/g.299166 Transcript_103415/m.299166 type:complete len:336 (-) Transcript_103415:69-1076(-)